MTAEPDAWSRWLLERRDAGDDHQRSVSLEHLRSVRDRVLDNAEPLAAATLLDVGTGDGLIGLEALDRIGPDGRVIFSDVSGHLLDRCREAASERGRLDRARFVRTDAAGLDEIQDATVDIATTRSVLIYVADVAHAFAALHRTLRPGGRISLFEPINRLMFPEPEDRLWGYDVGEVADLANRVKAAYDELEDPAAATLLGFDDRDLVRFAEAAGFERVHLECHIDIDPGSSMRAIGLSSLLDSAPNPLAPTLRGALSAALTASEQDRFVGQLERAVVGGRHVRRSAVAYLAASKAHRTA